MLVVVACIVILLGLLMPAAQGVLKQVDKAKASTDIATVSVGLRQYYNDYGVWPTNTSATLTAPMLQDVYLILTGSNQNSGNPRHIVYLHIKAKDLKGVSTTLSSGLYPVSAGSATTNWVDPWDHSYMMSFDTLGSNSTIIPGGTANASFAVWSGGPDGAVDNASTTAAKNSDNIVSW